MKKLLIILLLLPAWAWAGTEVIDPDADVRIDVGWTESGCASGDWYCLSDNVDPGSQIYTLGWDYPNIVCIVSAGTAATSDSTIDSVGITLRLQVQNLSTTPATVDSVGGQTAALRVGSPITLSSASTWENHETVYTQTPDGAAFTWSDIADYHFGIKNYYAESVNLLQCSEIWITVYYSYAEAVGGGGNLVKVLK